MKVRTILVTAGLTMISGCTLEPAGQLPALPFYRTAALAPEWIGIDSLDDVPTHRIADFSTHDQANAEITGTNLDGRITVVDFFFTRCPGICLQLSRGMRRLQDSLAGDGVQLLSFSVTPEQDSVPVLRRYAIDHGAIDGTWHLLTGDRRSIYQLARASFFADVDTSADAFLHTETIYLIDGKRRIRGIYNGTLGTDIVQLVGDARRLRSEGSWNCTS